jgi:hypothetical protein
MEGYSSTGQSPQGTVAPMEVEEEYLYSLVLLYGVMPN